jgi:hypothetical protein
MALKFKQLEFRLEEALEDQEREAVSRQERRIARKV